jgi:hypothetical protein
MTEGRDSNPGGLSGLKDRPAFVNGYLDAINCQFDLICHLLINPEGLSYRIESL